MTTRIEIHMAGHDVAITTIDRCEGLPDIRKTQIVRRGERPPEYLCTWTTRTVEIVDLDPSDPRLEPGDKPE